MNDIETRIAMIKSRIKDAERKKTKAEIQRDQAKSALKEAAKILQNDFGVSSLEEAYELRNSMQGSLNERVEQIETYLSSLFSEQSDIP